MRDPLLSPDQFSRDRVLKREQIGIYDQCSFQALAVASKEFITIRSSATLILKLALNFPDLSKFNQLSFAALNKSREPILVGLKMTHGPGSAQVGEKVISFTGTREFLPPGIMSDLKFPRESFGSYGSRTGWDDIRELEIIFAREKTYRGGETMEILVGSFFGEFRQIPFGPRLSLRGLAEVLDRDISPTPSFFSHDARRNSRSGTSEHMPCYPAFTEEDPGLFVPPPHPYPLETAEEILQGFIMGQRVGNPICWDVDPLGRQEWLHFLHRHHFLKTLVRALAQTGDECYAAALDRIIHTWIRTNAVPVGSNGGAGPSWETLSTAWRLREWLWVAGIAWFRESFHWETRQLMLCSIWEHARNLMDHRGHPNNWIIVESAALALAGMCFPEFSEAEQWAKVGIERLSQEVERQFLDDGTHFEISPLYHSICLAAMLEVTKAAQLTGCTLPNEFDAALEKATGYLAALCRPNFTWPSINDSGGVTGNYVALMQALGHYFGSPEFKWIGSYGKSGNHPQLISQIFPNAGMTTMRSDYGRYANHLVFRSGPPGATHVHGDVLSLDISALGMPRLVDPGITAYAPDVLTDHYRCATAHNTLLLDGKGANRTAAFPQRGIQSSESWIFWNSSDGMETVTGICRGPWGNDDRSALLCRTIIFIKGEYWIVRDILTGSGIHEITACWQFFPGRVGIATDTKALTFLDARGPRFGFIPLLHNPEFKFETWVGSMQPCSGWVSLNGSDYPAASFAYSVSGSMPMTLAWLLVPFWGSPDLSIEAKRFDGIKGDVELKIVFSEGHEDSLRWEFPDLVNWGKGSRTVRDHFNFKRIKTTGL